MKPDSANSKEPLQPQQANSTSLRSISNGVDSPDTNSSEQPASRSSSISLYDILTIPVVIVLIVAMLILLTNFLAGINPELEDNSLFISVRNDASIFAGMFVFFGGFLFMIPVVLYGIIYGHMRARDTKSVMQLILFYLCAMVLAGVMIWLQSLSAVTRL